MRSIPAASHSKALNSLQLLRGLAAMMVVGVHVHLQLERLASAPAYWPFWFNSGVDIFFLLSGFLMWSTTAGRSITPWEFYRRRLARIVPLYWVLTSFVVGIFVFAPHLMQSPHFDGLALLGSYGMFFVERNGSVGVSVLGPAWTLNYEMFFYLLYGGALLLPAAFRFFATALVIGGLIAFGYVRAGVDWWGAPYTVWLMAEFVGGMAIAVWWGRPVQRSSSPWSGAALLLAGALALPLFQALLSSGIERAVEFGIPAALILIGSLLLERSGALPGLPLLRWLGDISYSIYLSHPIVLSACGQIWRRAGLQTSPLSWLTFSIFSVVVCVVVGALVYRCIELPLTRLFRVRTGAKAAPPDVDIAVPVR